MSAFLYLAARHIRFQAGRSSLIVALFAVLTAIPLIGERMASFAEAELMTRAEVTPMVYGPAGSALDLTLDALFFTGAPRTDLTMAAYDAMADQGLATIIPLLRTHAAQGFPIVGVDVEYLEFRDLRIAAGRPMVRLGEAVIGAEAAQAMDLAVGDEVQSDARGAFDIAGAAPVRLTVTGVLAPTGGADDRAILTSLRSAWLVAGLGHGHQDLADAADGDVVLSRKDGVVVANAKLRNALRVTDQNRAEFHFHGEPADFPLSALLVAPHDARSAALLRGRVDDAGPARQLFRPAEVIRRLLDDIFRVRALFGVVTSVLGAAGLAALGGMVALALRLRRPEFEVARRFGADRGAMFLLVATELVLLLIMGLLLALGVAALFDLYGRGLYTWALFGGT